MGLEGFERLDAVVQRWRLCLPSPHLPPPPQGFDSSAGKKHEDAAVGAVKVKSTRGARQYMNRKVGRQEGAVGAGRVVGGEEVLLL